MKLSMIALVVVGLVAALSVAILVGSYQASLSSERNRLLGGGTKEVTVLTARRALGAFTRITAEDIEQRTVEQNIAPPNHLSDPIEVIGRIAAMGVEEGQAITSSALLRESDGAGLAASIQPGMRAKTVSIPDYAGLETLLFPGARVDVLATFNLRNVSRSSQSSAVSMTMLRSVQVLAINGDTLYEDEAEAREARERRGQRISTSSTRLKVTLAVAPRQAEALDLAMEYGSLSLALRNPLDNTHPDTDATVLSEGRLANWAEYLETQVRSPLEAGLASPAEAAPSAAPETIQPIEAKPLWNVYIMRGGKVEVRSFVREGGREAEGDWMDAAPPDQGGRAAGDSERIGAAIGEQDDASTQ